MRIYFNEDSYAGYQFNFMGVQLKVVSGWNDSWIKIVPVEKEQNLMHLSHFLNLEMNSHIKSAFSIDTNWVSDENDLAFRTSCWIP